MKQFPKTYFHKKIRIVTGPNLHQFTLIYNECESSVDRTYTNSKSSAFMQTDKSRSKISRKRLFFCGNWNSLRWFCVGTKLFLSKPNALLLIIMIIGSLSPSFPKKHCQKRTEGRNFHVKWV